MAGRAPTSRHAREAATRIVHALRDAGHTAYFAGGCVRDELLGLSPSDYDVATDATPDRVKHLFPNSDLVGACFGVVIVRQRVDGAPVVVEVATFRSDGTYSDSRRPDSVTFSTPEADAARRDFTINALFLDPADAPRPGDGPLPPTFSGGRVIDHVGGLADLNARVLRAVGEPSARLAEDHLRALRAVRLVARLNFTLDSATADAIRRDASSLRGVSRERIGDELRRMLAHPSRTTAVTLLRDLGLERPVLGLSADFTLAPDRLRPGLVIAALQPDAPATLALAAWALDLGLHLTDGAIDALARTLRESLCLSNEERDDLRHALRGLHALRHDWPGWPVARRKRFAASPALAPGLALLHAIAPADAAQRESDLQSLRLSPGGIAPAPFLTGDHLVAVGWAPGPHFKHVLDTVYDAQLEGRIADHQQAMELAQSMRVYK